MRRALVIAIAIPALALSACSSDGESTTSDDSAATSATRASSDDASSTTATSTPRDDKATKDDKAKKTDDTADATKKPDDDDDDDGVEGGSDGQEAADVTKKFITALTEADPKMCTYMADLQGEGTGPLRDDEELLKICEQTIPSQTKGKITKEQSGILDVMEITGADVQGDTAKVDKDNFSDLFAAGFGKQTFVLKKYNGTWYVDLGLSKLSPPDEG